MYDLTERDVVQARFTIPKTARRLIEQWAAVHRADLEANWARLKAGQALERIAPLE